MEYALILFLLFCSNCSLRKLQISKINANSQLALILLV